MKVVTSQQMRELEDRMSAVGVSGEELLQRAGLALADEIERWTGAVRDQNVVVLVGPGNNGGDGLVAGRHLAQRGASVIAYLWRRSTEDVHVVDAKKAGVNVLSVADDHDYATFRAAVAASRMVVDALFGIGTIRPFAGDLPNILETVRSARHPSPPDQMLAIPLNPSKQAAVPFVFAVDVPSGVNADTGEADPATLAADVTITFAFPKVGLFAFPARGLVGALSVVDIGISEELASDIHVEALTPRSVCAMLPERPLDANKGTFGRVLVMAGSLNYVGAASLATAAVGRVGAGLVTLATPRTLLPILAGKLTESTFEPLDEIDPGVAGQIPLHFIRRLLDRYGYALIGCGLGQHQATQSFILHTLRTMHEADRWPTVVDADALNTLARQDRWWQILPRKTVITPHPGEMARLAGSTVEEVQKNRLAVAMTAALEWQTVVVLKGACTVIAEPTGRATLSPFANPVMASAGTGDVLAGSIAGLLAQKLTPASAAECGVYLHGLAGELAGADIGSAGVLAGDILDRLPFAIRQLRRGEVFRHISNSHTQVLWT